MQVMAMGTRDIGLEAKFIKIKANVDIVVDGYFRLGAPVVAYPSNEKQRMTEVSISPLTLYQAWTLGCVAFWGWYECLSTCDGILSRLSAKQL